MSGSVFARLRPKVGAWHIGWRFKAWIGMGDWLRFEIGLGSAWFFCGRFTAALVSAHNETTGDRELGLKFYWQGRRA